ncbi:hypothetical protein M2155_001990 [Streptomyces sp. SAI-119]|uniref:hypothetical protein n=1 Tax=Streptomyces sp. SAI-119 TaxID=2940541 RepID=UPI002474C8A0|nr:hypothetical protein [Streptomyces sp. SAI-119]MDH6449582.1 hypothetical protein [Streptomyces sp. SAI-119]
MSSATASARPYVEFTKPAEASHPAYRIFVAGPFALSNQPGQLVSRALLRAVLIDVARNTGVMARTTTGAVRYEYPGLPDVFTAHPERSPDLPTCALCGQWKAEHENASNASHCGKFTFFGVPGTDSLLCTTCRQPHGHHGQPFTVACDDFQAANLWGHRLAPYTTVRFLVIRHDGWVLENVELPADHESAARVVEQAKADTAHEAERGRDFLYMPAGSWPSNAWKGEATHYGTVGRP